MSNSDKREQGTTNRRTSHPVRRFVAGTAIAGAAVYGAADLVPKAFHDVKDRAHQGQEFNTYSQYHLYQKMQENGGFNAGEVVTYEISSDPNENPTTIAERLGAKDLRSVAAEIASQEGGDRRLQPGDNIVLPRDQLKHPGPAEAPVGSEMNLG